MKDLFKPSAVVIVFQLLLLAFTTSSNSQALQSERQVAAPLPKLALLGAEPYTRGGKKYHRIVLTVTNHDRYSLSMFETGSIPALPPNPCVNLKARVTAAVYSESGETMTKCMSFPTPSSLKSFAFLVEQGKPIPKFVYLVLTDIKTGGAYRSNLISPSTGLGK